MISNPRDWVSVRTYTHCYGLRYSFKGSPADKWESWFRRYADREAFQEVIMPFVSDEGIETYHNDEPHWRRV